MYNLEYPGYSWKFLKGGPSIFVTIFDQKSSKNNIYSYLKVITYFAFKVRGNLMTHQKILVHPITHLLKI